MARSKVDELDPWRAWVGSIHTLLRGEGSKCHPEAGGRYAPMVFEDSVRGARALIWTMELASYLEDAPWPATKEELIDYAIRTGAPAQVVENLQELEEGEEPYESLDEIWPDYPSDEDFFFEDEGEY